MTSPTLTIDTESEPGAWRDALRFPPFDTRIAETFRSREPAGRMAGDTAETAGPGLSDHSFHGVGNSSAGQQDHG